MYSGILLVYSQRYSNSSGGPTGTHLPLIISITGFLLLHDRCRSTELAPTHHPASSVGVHNGSLGWKSEATKATFKSRGCRKEHCITSASFWLAVAAQVSITQREGTSIRKGFRLRVEVWAYEEALKLHELSSCDNTRGDTERESGHQRQGFTREHQRKPEPELVRRVSLVVVSADACLYEPRMTTHDVTTCDLLLHALQDDSNGLLNVSATSSCTTVGRCVVELYCRSPKHQRS